MARDEQALRDAMEHSAAVLAAAGFPRMPARVLMALTVADAGGLTAQELAEELGVSAAAISGAVRYLQTLGYVRRTAQAGSRRDRYELPADLWYGASFRKSPLFDSLASLLDRAVEAIDDPACRRHRCGRRRWRGSTDLGTTDAEPARRVGGNPSRPLIQPPPPPPRHTCAHPTLGGP